MWFIFDEVNCNQETTFAGGLFFDYLGVVLPTVDNLRNFLLRSTTEMLTFFQSYGNREAVLTINQYC